MRPRRSRIHFSVSSSAVRRQRSSWIHQWEFHRESVCLPPDRNRPPDHNWGLLREMLVTAFPRVPVPQPERQLSPPWRPGLRHPRLKQVRRWCPRSQTLRFLSSTRSRRATFPTLVSSTGAFGYSGVPERVANRPGRAEPTAKRRRTVTASRGNQGSGGRPWLTSTVTIGSRPSAA